MPDLIITVADLIARLERVGWHQETAFDLTDTFGVNEDRYDELECMEEHLRRELLPILGPLVKSLLRSGMVDIELRDAGNTAVAFNGMDASLEAESGDFGRLNIVLALANGACGDRPLPDWFVRAKQGGRDG